MKACRKVGGESLKALTARQEVAGSTCRRMSRQESADVARQRKSEQVASFSADVWAGAVRTAAVLKVEAWPKTPFARVA